MHPVDQMTHTHDRMDDDGDDRSDQHKQPLLPRLGPSDDGNGDASRAHQPPHQEGPWELVASSSSNELDEAEQEAAYEQREGVPFVPLPLHHHQPPLLPWVHAPPTPTTTALPTSGAVDQSWGLRRRRLAKLLFWPPPIARWLPRYTRQQALGDLLGGVTVAVMVIPQGMSYAVLAGLPPVYGLFAAMTGPVVYTLLGTSRTLSIGPVALVSLALPKVCEVLYPSLADLPADSEEATQLRVQAATAVALVSGLLLAALGFLRLGAISHAFPPGLMVGFTAAAALAIGVSQVKELLGLKVPRFEYTWQTGWYVLSHLEEGQPASAAVGLGCILFLLGSKHAKARWVDGSPNLQLQRACKFLYPLSNLALVVATALIARALVRRGVDIAIVKDVPSGLPTPQAPKLAGRFWAVAGHSLPVVLVAFLEAYAIGRKYALQEGYPLHVNRELLALGAANAVAAFFASYPVSGSFSRSAVSHAAGTATQLANAIAAALVALTVQYLAPSFHFIPRATLGAIIEVALLNLLDPRALLHECRRSRGDALVVAATFTVTLALDTELGLLAGLGTALLVLYWTPRGGALLTRLLLRPALKRRPRCDVLVLDLARLCGLTPRVRRRLADYLQHERAARGAGPHLLVLLDGGRVAAGGGGGSAVAAGAAVRDAVAAAEAAGVPKEMVVVLGLPVAVADAAGGAAGGDNGGEEKTGKDGQEERLLVLSPAQAEVARGVLERAHSLGLVSEFGEEVALRLHASAGEGEKDDGR